jgi:hypothetical protein
MGKTYRSAQGKMIDMEKLRLANEETIAVGNMRVNARGDELGPGGEIIRTRNEVMEDYYKLNSPTIKATYPETIVDEKSIHPKLATPPSTIRGSLAQQISQKQLSDSKDTKQ